ncbi:CatB-related O-acetyltransferase [Flavobacterium phragmitis]|uniref:Transferase hexapeptide (Six repeat-containing protein) n=1 Tax=Flavobacterium phragmitis TaxID=739143 RepID=A0A1I1QSN7_9FLAO|nr:CatB-related O-acetyltransferase [Flavobacterium phragmitis]SFD25017.1 transferase hexapeptide (six repeat-containing protein) [Flavobacterium phragmitis]
MLKVGKYTYGLENISLFWGAWDDVTIGSFCSIAIGLKLFLGGNHRADWITTYPFGHIHQDVFDKFLGNGHPATNGGITIGNDVWISSNVTIMSGVTIGDGAIIAANSHVVKNVEPYSIVGGNPAKFIKYRFSKEQIDELLKIKWWEWDDEKINQECSMLCNENLGSFIRKHAL